jgi:hypothetical protein
MTPLVPLRIAIGEPFAFEFTVLGQDWTGYSGTATFKATAKDEDAFVTVAATGNSAGLVQIALTADQTLLLPSLPRLGYFRQGVYQVRMAGAGDVQTFQGNFGTAASV